jgi:hypothetical protein
LNNRDKKNHLLDFEDCVYDFSTSPPGFREGKAEDMVTITLKYTKEQVDDCDIAVQAKIVDALKDMHDKDVFEYIIKTLATSVHGDIAPTTIFKFG